MNLVRLFAALLALAAGLRGAEPVLLVALDGFRHDYVDKYDAPNLRAFRDRGSHAAALTPAFPSNTFPNFYAMATGLLPRNHGIVNMNFWDPDRKERFTYSDKADADNASWWGGVPFWVSVERAGLRSAILFWPGSAAPIQGTLPWDFTSYDPAVTVEQKIERVRGWFALPEKERPRLAAVYFPNVDSAGHRHGPESAETREAVATVDRAFGEIMSGLANVAVNVIVVSDHGMVEIEGSLVLRADTTGCEVTNGTHVHVHCADPRDTERLYNALNRRGPGYRIYRRAGIPRELEYSNSRRIGDLVILPNRPYLMELVREGVTANVSASRGAHGFEATRYPDLGGILYAAGPAIRPGVRLTGVRTVDVYPLVMQLLDLPPERGIDGRLSRVRKLLR